MKALSFRSLVSSLLALALTGSSALAGMIIPVTQDIKGGTASLKLDSALIGLLNIAGITEAKINPGTFNRVKGTVVVPIKGGALDTVTGGGEVSTSGGFEFKQGVKIISAVDYIFTISGGTGTVSALVTINGGLLGRQDLATFAVTLPTPVTIPKSKQIKLANLALKLSSDAAAALNTAFSTSAFSAGQNLGAYNITINFAGKL